MEMMMYLCVINAYVMRFEWCLCASLYTHFLATQQPRVVWCACCGAGRGHCCWGAWTKQPVWSTLLIVFMWPESGVFMWTDNSIKLPATNSTTETTNSVWQWFWSQGNSYFWPECSISWQKEGDALTITILMQSRSSEKDGCCQFELCFYYNQDGADVVTAFMSHRMYKSRN